MKVSTMFVGNNRPNKRELQSQMYSKVTNNRIIGLGGVSVGTYVSSIKSSGKFKEIEIYENDRPTFLNQLRFYKGGYKLKFGNILKHLDKNAFYDLDFCCSIYSIEPYLPKIFELNEFSLTISARPAGLQKTLSIINNYKPKDCVLSYKTYKDTSPMITILKQKQ